MSIALITGSAGLVGSEAARFMHERGFDIVGVDNDMRQYFFGADGSTAWNRAQLEKELPNYRHCDLDIRDVEGVNALFAECGKAIALVIHAAAQPSHDWAAREPLTDFAINANGTLHLLEATRRCCPDAVFIFASTNKVYGDAPNELPLVECATRYELDAAHPFREFGIDESLRIDQCQHSLFGASKLAGDILTQEYGRYFRSQDRRLSRRLSNRPSPFGRRTARLFGLPSQMRGHGEALHHLRLQRQTGARQHPQPRPRLSLLALLPKSPRRRSVQYGRWAPRQRLRARGH